MNLNFTRIGLIALTLLCAGNGFLVETNLIQTISAAMGGTILQYQLGIGLFVCSLGMGSLGYPWVAKRFSAKTIMGFSIVGLATLSILGPLLIHWVGQNMGLSFSSLAAWVVYLPLILTGLITGLDLPTLIFFGQELGWEAEEKILGSDYIGMVLAGLAFPLLFIQGGLLPVALSSLALAGLAGLLLFVMPAGKKDSPDNAKKEKPAVFWLTLCFALSFCSLSYEIILARWMVDFFDNEVFALNYSIGFYLAGLGVGSFSFKKTRSLLSIEAIIVVSALSFPFLSYFVASFWKTYFFKFVHKEFFQFFFLAFVAWVGYWSGQEIPFLLHKVDKTHNTDVARLFFWNYLGALAASVAVSLVLIPLAGLKITLLVIVAINVFTGLIYCLRERPSWRIGVWSLAAFLLAVTYLPRWTQTWEQIYLKSIYNQVHTREASWRTVKSFFTLHRELNDIRRVVTPYQNIDLVRTEIPAVGNGYDDLHLYLNRQPQFSLFTHELYHDSFSFAAINLHGRVPRKILVLGGGDGLLAHRLRGLEQVESIKLIELDPKMIEVAKNHVRIKKANGNVFSSPKVEVILADAFSWLKESGEIFDGIFVDFPYPINYELSRLYSIEFYRLVADHLNPKGFMILNAPISFSFDANQKTDFTPTRTLLNTLEQAGFASLLPFGSREPFIFAEKQKRSIEFDYDNVPDDLANSSFVNWVPIAEVQLLAPTSRINSVYAPKKVVTW